MTETWSYHSVLSVTVPGDQTSKYWPGMKLKIVQSDGTKYFIIESVQYSSPNTTITLNGMGFYLLINSAIISHSKSTNAAPVGFPSQPRIFRIGPTIYEANYNYPDSSYFVLDRESDFDDCSIVFRTQGNARAEFGLITDSDFHFKTASGTYPSEVFTDRFIIRATGACDAFGGLLRAYGTSGVHSVVAGNSNLSTGAGLELTYDQDNTQAHITSIERGNCYRNLNVGGQNILFYTGAVSLVQILSLGSDGNAVFAGDVSALSFTDRTRAFSGDAVDAISKIKPTDDGYIDHSTLPLFALSAYHDERGEWWPGRDIGNMVTILVKAVQELADRLDNLEKTIAELKTKKSG